MPISVAGGMTPLALPPYPTPEAPMTVTAMKKSNRVLTLMAFAVFLPALCVVLFSGPILTHLGQFIVRNETPVKSDAVVVLYTGVDYYPRLIEAARLYRQGFVDNVVIDGNRKTDVLREIEKKGFRPGCHWASDFIQILSLYGVPETAVITVSAEDAFDTISEAQAVGGVLIDKKIRKVIVTTSKFHTRRANHIWTAIFQGRIDVTTVAARTDPYQPSGWWKEGRQIRWVMTEYGAWLYYLWHRLGENLAG